jgi:hypothetical protein
MLVIFLVRHIFYILIVDVCQDTGLLFIYCFIFLKKFKNEKWVYGPADVGVLLFSERF